jgi:hypothetical protein
MAKDDDLELLGPASERPPASSRASTRTNRESTNSIDGIVKEARAPGRIAILDSHGRDRLWKTYPSRIQGMRISGRRRVSFDTPI